MRRYNNRGVGGALGIIGFALIGNHIGLIALILLLCWLPLWFYITAIICIAIIALIVLFTQKYKDKDETDNPN